jgi:hypothetical protein
MNVSNRFIFVALLLFAFLTCSKNPNAPDYEKEIAVFGFLWGNKPMTAERAMMISYTQPIDAAYDLEQATIKNANVTISEVSTGKIYVLDDAKKPGFYFNDSLIAKPKTEYFLKIEVDNKVVMARTSVPPLLNLVTDLQQGNVDSVYQDRLSFEQPIFVDCEDGEQIIIVDVYCNESWENAEYINPFWGQKKPGDAGEYGGQDGNSEPRHIVASAKFKDLFSLNFPGQYVIDWYASMIGFFGSYTMQVMAIDDNYYNFINKNEYPELQSGVQGGIGVFGSMCGEMYQLYILKP